jgi:hypothetical protein
MIVMQPDTSATDPLPRRFRRLFVLHALPGGEWLVTAEGMSERHVFAHRPLALGYAGLWASANAPSQLVERRADGTLGTLREYD